MIYLYDSVDKANAHIRRDGVHVMSLLSNPQCPHIDILYKWLFGNKLLDKVDNTSQIKYTNCIVCFSCSIQD